MQSSIFCNSIVQKNILNIRKKIKPLELEVINISYNKHFPSTAIKTAKLKFMYNRHAWHIRIKGFFERDMFVI